MTIRIAAIKDTELQDLIDSYRLCADNAERVVDTPEKVKIYRAANLKWASIMQELLDRRIASREGLSVPSVFSEVPR